MKQDLNEINNLEKVVNSSLNIRNNNNNLIYVSPVLGQIMSKVIQIKPELDEKSFLIKNKITTNSNKGHISVRK